MSQAEVSPAAELDANRIVDYLDQRNPLAAEQWLQSLVTTYEFLAQNPGLGHSQKEYTNKSVLFWNYGDYLIVYSVHPGRIEILAVQHGSRDVPAFLEKRLK